MLKRGFILLVLIFDFINLSILPSQAQIKYINRSDFDGKRIAVNTGTIHGEVINEVLPSAEVLYFEADADVIGAVLTGKADAYAQDEEILKQIVKENDNLTMADGYLKTFDNALIFTKTSKGDKLRNEFNEYLMRIKSDGTLEKINDIWLGYDENLKTVLEYEKLPDLNGTIRITINNETPPFEYVKDGRIIGLEVDVIARFCKEKGYKPVLVPGNFSSLIPAVASKKCDIGIGSITITEERAQSVNFSEPIYTGGSRLLILKSNAEASSVQVGNDGSDFAGKKIGVQVGTTCAELVPKQFPSAEVSFFNSITDSLTALKTGKISAVCCALPSAVYVMNEEPNLEILEPYLHEAYLYSIFVNSDRGKELCEEYSAFLKTLWDDGTIEELKNKWLGSDESKKTVEDYSRLPATNGTLKMAVDTSIVPFAYVKDNKIVGHAVDLAVRFCKAKGYGLEISDMSLSAVIAAVKAGKCDFTQAMTKSKERGENTLFASSPSMKSGNVLLVMKNNNNTVDKEFLALAGKRIGVVTGSTHPQIVAKYVPTAELVYFYNAADEITALKAGKIDAYCAGIPFLRRMKAMDGSIIPYGKQLTFTEGAPIFQKNEKGEKLCAQFSEFAKACWDNGTIKELEAFWFDQEESKCIMKDYSNLPAPNGVLKAAVNEVSQPFVYFKDNRIIGYDIDFVVRFCEAYGYGLEIVPMRFSGIIPAVTTGKCDFGIGAITITDERKESVLFSYPHTRTGNMFAVRKDMAVPNTEETEIKSEPSFFDELKASFERTFMREERYKLFIDGIINTMIITTLSIIFGTMLGFILHIFCRSGNIFANLLTDFSMWLIRGTPVVVLLMILYYIIFGSVDIKGIWVAVMAFTMTFGTAFYRMLKFGTGAIDKGQNEAAYALGFTDNQTFFKVILPQAALHFMPTYKAEVTTLIKSTSIVGYIAVQDLTKMGDIVRSRTYEAFFPLIAVAAIYFILAGILNFIVNIIQVRITPSKRKPKNILRGIKLSGGDNNHD